MDQGEGLVFATACIVGWLKHWGGVVEGMGQRLGARQRGGCQIQKYKMAGPRLSNVA